MVMSDPFRLPEQCAVFSGDVGTVVVYKLDRLSRSLRDGINVPVPKHLAAAARAQFFLIGRALSLRSGAIIASHS
jgi:hypothetical protein